MAAVSSRYARAFAQVAAASHLDTDAAQQQMKDFAATLVSSRPLREVLSDPSIPGEQKVRVLDGIAGRLGMFPAVRNFLAVIIDHGRLEDLEEMLREYAVLADEGAGLTEVEIVTARPVGEAERRTLEGKAAELAGGRIRTTYREDPTLLGGAVLKIGSTVYDGSLRAQLAGLEQRLAEGVPV